MLSRFAAEIHAAGPIWDSAADAPECGARRFTSAVLAGVIFD
jgi:hypothetical protein